MGAYIDKYLVFPKSLKAPSKRAIKTFHLTHIIDHSNAIYLRTIRKTSSVKCLLTCHDLIAIRTALGEFPFAPKTSSSGKRLQKWIKDSYHLPISMPVIPKKPKRTLIVSFLYHQNPQRLFIWAPIGMIPQVQRLSNFGFRSSSILVKQSIFCM